MAMAVLDWLVTLMFVAYFEQKHCGIDYFKINCIFAVYIKNLQK